jgi:hypothetical protein
MKSQFALVKHGAKHRCGRLSLLSGVLLAAAVGFAQASSAHDATLELTEETLNALADRLGSPGAVGIHQTSGSAVDWQWWVTNARFKLGAGAMSFTATVHWRVASQSDTETRSVPASIGFDPASNRLAINVAPFMVPVQSGEVTVTQADIAKLYSFSISVEPQDLSVPLPGGDDRELTARAEAMTAEYAVGKVLIGVDVSFESVIETQPPPEKHPEQQLGRVARRASRALPHPDWGSLFPTGTGSARVRVYEAAFNEFADAIEPLVFKGHYTKKTCTWLPVFGNSCTTICSSDWTAKVDGLRFNITPTKVKVTGKVNAQWCGVSFDAELETSADVAYMRSIVLPGRGHVPFNQGMQSHEGIRVTVNPTDIQPVFHVLEHEVELPFHIDVAPAMSLPTIPVGTALLSFETAAGPQDLRLSPSHVALVKRNGSLELQAQVSLW